jgi:hypothetical protein
MAYATEIERRLMRALNSLLAVTDDDSLLDQQHDPRLREEFRAVRESAQNAADRARDVLVGWDAPC